MIGKGDRDTAQELGKIGKAFPFYCDDRQKTYRKDASFAQDGARAEDCFLRFWFRFVLPNQALIEMERNDLLLESWSEITMTIRSWCWNNIFAKRLLRRSVLPWLEIIGTGKE